MNETIFHQAHHVQKLKIVHSNDKSHPRLRELFLMDIFTQLLFFFPLRRDLVSVPYNKSLYYGDVVSSCRKKVFSRFILL